MSEVRRRQSVIVLAITLVAAVAAGLAIWAWFEARDDDQGRATPFDSSEQAALDAASRNVANIASFRRAKFDADYTRALSGTTGGVYTTFQQKKAAYKQAIDQGKFDLSAKITHVALIGRVDTDKVQGYDVLVSFNGFRSTQQNLPTQQNLRVTMQNKDGKWLIADLTSIGAS